MVIFAAGVSSDTCIYTILRNLVTMISELEQQKKGVSGIFPPHFFLSSYKCYSSFPNNIHVLRKNSGHALLFLRKI